MDLIFKHFDLGVLQLTIKETTYTIKVDAYEHGVRFSTPVEKSILVDGERVITGSARLYFGEGKWLALPSIEEAILDSLNGELEDVETFSAKYDDLMAAALPEFITGNRLKGFLKDEYERLTSQNDLQSPIHPS